MNHRAGHRVAAQAPLDVLLAAGCAALTDVVGLAARWARCEFHLA
jgi:hypothetical protein